MEAGPTGPRTRMDAPKEAPRARPPIGPERHIKKIPQNHEILFENKILLHLLYRVQVYMSKWLRSLTNHNEASMKTKSVTTIETVIGETKTEITMPQIRHKLTMADLKREEVLTERYMKLEKGKEMHDLTHYVPRFNGMEW